MALKDFCEITTTAEPFLDPQSLAAYRRRAEQLENRAVFEIPSLLQQVRERLAFAASSGKAD
jgi:hypothetical protein